MRLHHAIKGGFLWMARVVLRRRKSARLNLGCLHEGASASALCLLREKSAEWAIARSVPPKNLHARRVSTDLVARRRKPSGVLQGRTIEVDPGPHTFTFATKGAANVSVQTVMVEQHSRCGGGAAGGTSGAGGGGTAGAGGTPSPIAVGHYVHASKSEWRKARSMRRTRRSSTSNSARCCR